MAFLYSATLFASAFLLFSIQPMAGKFLLPLLGGAPDVWNTCMVFFQLLLLLGYLYAHALTRHFSPRLQGPVHLLVIVAACVCVFISGTPHPDAATLANTPPSFWILRTLFVWLGMPVFLLTATSPLLQLWYSRTGKTKDPYFLYSASNLGSLLALLSYPLVLEPLFTLSVQRVLWGAGYLALAGALTIIASTRHGAPNRHAGPPARPIAPLRLARWTLLAFIASSLLLAVTTYLSTDIAPVPLMWVVPLALYLLTFIAATRGIAPARLAGIGRALGLTALFTVSALTTYFDYPMAVLVALHLAMFVLAATLCHGLLMNSRPPASQLTTFYLCVALGGVLGGIFNTLVAPQIFSTLAEYPLGIVLAILLRPGSAQSVGARALFLDVIYAATIGLCAVALPTLSWLAPWLPQHLHNLLVLGIPALLCLRASRKNYRFALALTALYVSTTFVAADGQKILLRQRSFFGSLLVYQDTQAKANLLYHGRTLHGVQSLKAEKRQEPLSYYSRLGPVADILGHGRTRADVAVVGLGAGSLATYARPGEHWTFYEINPQIVAIARDPKYFTFLNDSAAGSGLQIELGDARLQLQQSADASLDLLIIDAFGSDSIPVHLVTREALNLYWRKLRPGGLMVFHVSNKYLDLARALGPLASATGAQAYQRFHNMGETKSLADFTRSSRWLVMAQMTSSLKPFARDSRWIAVHDSAQGRVWTDDYFNLLALLRIW